MLLVFCCYLCVGQSFSITSACAVMNAAIHLQLQHHPNEMSAPIAKALKIYAIRPANIIECAVGGDSISGDFAYFLLGGAIADS